MKTYQVRYMAEMYVDGEDAKEVEDNLTQIPQVLHISSIIPTDELEEEEDFYDEPPKGAA